MTFHRKIRGFTLFELMVAITSVAVIASVAVLGVSEVNSSMKTQKLERDVATINTAVKIYLSNGGQIGGSATAGIVITKLKSVPTGTNQMEIAGLRESMLDPRIEGIELEGPELQSTDPRAVWNQAKKRFDVVTTAGEAGYKAFRKNTGLLVHSPSFDTQKRLVNFKLAKNSNWVWDFLDSDNVDQPSYGPVRTGNASNNPGDLPNSPGGALPLQVPSYNPVAGTYALGEYFDADQFPVTITNPNPGGSSQIHYSTDGVTWDLYTGSQILVAPGESIAARTIAIDPDNWLDSAIETADYLADPVDLAISVSVPENPITYPQAGGEMLPGDTAAVSPVGPISVTLSNGGDVPVRYQNSGDFEVLWSFDGVDPRTSADASSTGEFTDGFPGISISYGLDEWTGGEDTLPVKVVARAIDTEVLADSPLSSTDVTISRLALSAPVSDLDDGGAYTAEQQIVLSPDASNGSLPVGWRIYYTTDGTDPGAAADGEPLSGNIYDGAFDLFTGSAVSSTVNARVYGPAGYGNWFTPSPMVRERFERWSPPGWSGYVGGIFSNSTYSTFRNIKQHKTDGVLDKSFNPGDGLNDQGRAVLVQPDGKVIAAGKFTSAHGVSRNRIARFEANGDLDTSFDVGAGANDEVLALALQADGKILVGGKFTRFNNQWRKGLVRLNTDGSIDWGYSVGQAVHSDDDGWVHAIDIQSDGKAVIGGCFSRYNYNSAKSLARVNTDGSFDSSLDTTPGVSGLLHSVKIQPDGKIVIGGGFSKYDNVSRSNVARVLANGRNDSAFDPGRGANKDVYTVSLFPDGKIFVGGNFSDIDKKKRQGVARLNSNGSVDSSYDIGSGHGIPSWIVYASAIESSGKVITGGNLRSYSPHSGGRAAFVRLNTDGTLDTSYTPEDLPQHSYVYGIALRPNQHAVVVGKFPEATDVTARNIARLDTETGEVDSSFDVGVGTDDDVSVLLELSNGDVLIGGEFDYVKGQRRDKLAQLGPDGTLRALSLDFNGEIKALAEQSDGKLLIGGDFYYVNGEYNRRLVRLNTNGSIDNSFVLDTNNGYQGFNNDVRDIQVMPDGTILVAGDFSYYAGIGQRGIVLLNADGSMNSLYSTDANPMPNDDVHDILLLPNGDVVYAGEFSGEVRRITALGVPDPSFSAASIDGDVFTVSLMTDGRLLIGGAFTNVGGSSRSRVAVLDSDGSLHSAFNSSNGADNTTYAVAAGEDGKAVALGRFNYYKGTSRDGTVRANPDGSIDASFTNPTLSVDRIYTTD